MVFRHSQPNSGLGSTLTFTSFSPFSVLLSLLVARQSVCLRLSVVDNLSLLFSLLVLLSLQPVFLRLKVDPLTAPEIRSESSDREVDVLGRVGAPFHLAHGALRQDDLPDHLSKRRASPGVDREMHPGHGPVHGNTLRLFEDELPQLFG